MFNDFIIIGPATDPAAIKGKSVKEALTAIQTKQGLLGRQVRNAYHGNGIMEGKRTGSS